MIKISLSTLWAQGDVVTHGVFIVLLAMSVSSWTVAFIRGVELLLLRKSMKAAQRLFWQQKNLQDAVSLLGQQQFNPFRELVVESEAVLAHSAAHQCTLESQFDNGEWLARCMKQSLSSCSSKLQRGLGVLASVSSTAPFVGLLGTVWGILHTLQTLGNLSEPSIAEIAGPIGEALVMTAFGLFVAIPAVLAYNAISRRNLLIMQTLDRFAHDLFAYLLTGRRITSGHAQAGA